MYVSAQRNGINTASVQRHSARRIQFGATAGPETNAAGGAEAAAAAAAGKTIGLRQAFVTLFKHLLHSENRKLAIGTILKYGSTILMLTPIGWVSLPVVITAGWLGGRMQEAALREAEKKGIQSGLLHAVGRLDKAIAADVEPDEIIRLGKECLNELLPGENSTVASARERIKGLMDGKVFKVLQHAYFTRRAVNNTFSGKVLRGLNRVAEWIPLKVLRLPIRIISYLFQGLLMLTHSGAARKFAKDAVQKAARRI